MDGRLHFTGLDDLEYDFTSNPQKIKKYGFFKRILVKLKIIR